jgi:hypothetical protein
VQAARGVFLNHEARVLIGPARQLSSRGLGRPAKVAFLSIFLEAHD